jgi:hypothetical protein
LIAGRVPLEGGHEPGLIVEIVACMGSCTDVAAFIAAGTRLFPSISEACDLKLNYFNDLDDPFRKNFAVEGVPSSMTGRN